MATESQTTVEGGRLLGAVVMLCLTFLGLAAVQFADRGHPPPIVADAIAGGGVEVGRIDSPRASLSIHSVDDMFVVLVSQGRSVGVAAHPTLGPTLCRVLDSPAMLAELHAAISAGTDRAKLASEYAVELGGGCVAVSSSGGTATVALRAGRRTAVFATTAAELRGLANELAGFILRHGGGGTVRTPVS